MRDRGHRTTARDDGRGRPDVRLHALRRAASAEAPGVYRDRWESRLRDAFVSVGEQIAAAVDVPDLLRSTLGTGVDLLGPAVRAGGAALADDRGRLHVVATSRGRTAAELTRVIGGDGPWQDCLTSAAPVSVGDLSLLRPRAPATWSARGFRSVHAIPMRLRDETVGSLTLLSTRSGEPVPDELAAVQAVVDVAATGLLQERLVRSAQTLPEPLRRTLQDRSAVERAERALMRHHGVAADEARRRLGEQARRTLATLPVLARDVLDGVLDAHLEPIDRARAPSAG